MQTVDTSGLWFYHTEAMALNDDSEILQELDDSVDDYDQNTEYRYDDGIANSGEDDSDEYEENWDPVWEDDPSVSIKKKARDDLDDYDETED